MTTKIKSGVIGDGVVGTTQIADDAVTSAKLDTNIAIAGTLGVTGVLTGTSLDISGDIDVDGTTNLDVVDIDGAVDMASTLTVGTKIFTGGMTLTNNDSGRIGLNRNPDTGDYVNSASFERHQINGANSAGDYLDFQNYNSSGAYVGGFRLDDGALITVPTAGKHAVFNENGIDADFRVESDGNANMFSINGGLSKASFGEAPQDNYGGMVHTGSLSVGNATHAGYSVYSSVEGNIAANSTVNVLEFEGPVYARYMTVTISAYQCQKQFRFTGYQGWDGQAGGAVGDLTSGTTDFNYGANSSDAACMVKLELISTSGTSGQPKYRLKVVSGNLSGQLYDATVVVKFYNPPLYVTYV